MPAIVESEPSIAELQKYITVVLDVFMGAFPDPFEKKYKIPFVLNFPRTLCPNELARVMDEELRSERIPNYWLPTLSPKLRKLRDSNPEYWDELVCIQIAKESGWYPRIIQEARQLKSALCLRYRSQIRYRYRNKPDGDSLSEFIQKAVAGVTIESDLRQFQKRASKKRANLEGKSSKALEGATDGGRDAKEMRKSQPTKKEAETFALKIMRNFQRGLLFELLNAKYHVGLKMTNWGAGIICPRGCKFVAWSVVFQNGSTGRRVRVCPDCELPILRTERRNESELNLGAFKARGIKNFLYIDEEFARNLRETVPHTVGATDRTGEDRFFPIQLWKCLNKDCNNLLFPTPDFLCDDPLNADRCPACGKGPTAKSKSSKVFFYYHLPPSSTDADYSLPATDGFRGKYVDLIEEARASVPPIPPWSITTFLLLRSVRGGQIAGADALMRLIPNGGTGLEAIDYGLLHRCVSRGGIRAAIDFLLSQSESAKLSDGGGVLSPDVGPSLDPNGFWHEYRSKWHERLNRIYIDLSSPTEEERFNGQAYPENRFTPIK